MLCEKLEKKTPIYHCQVSAQSPFQRRFIAKNYVIRSRRNEMDLPIFTQLIFDRNYLALILHVIKLAGTLLLSKYVK